MLSFSRWENQDPEKFSNSWKATWIVNRLISDFFLFLFPDNGSAISQILRILPGDNFWVLPTSYSFYNTSHQVFIDSFFQDSSIVNSAVFCFYCFNTSLPLPWISQVIIAASLSNIPTSLSDLPGVLNSGCSLHWPGAHPSCLTPTPPFCLHLIDLERNLYGYFLNQVPQVILKSSQDWMPFPEMFSTTPKTLRSPRIFYASSWLLVFRHLSLSSIQNSYISPPSASR